MPNPKTDAAGQAPSQAAGKDKPAEGERRRRRRRPRGAQNSQPAQGGVQASRAQNAQNAQSGQPHPNGRGKAPTKAAPAQSGENRAPGKRGRGGSQPAPAQNAPRAQGGGRSQNQNQNQNKGGHRAPAAEPKAPRAPEPRRPAGGKTRRAPVDEDPGLELITRRPPKQKFANFEEYIAAHGGVTVPVEGDEPEPPADPA